MWNFLIDDGSEKEGSYWITLSEVNEAEKGELPLKKMEVK
jgi:hypothetical protein